MKIKLLVLLVISTVLFSCVSKKEVVYFQSTSKKLDNEQIVPQEIFVVKIQTGDILSVVVSSISKDATDMFNPFPEKTSFSLPAISSVVELPAVGYLVDELGQITLPLVGSITVSGLSSKEASLLITKKLDEYLVQPTVIVRMLNFKISILGEVARPSVYTISNGKITLPEAIGLAGDLTIFGKRNNILIIRDIGGKKEFARVDITKREFFTSPYYYLIPNDIVYVEPVTGRLTATDRVVQLGPLIISALTLLTIVSTNLLR